MCQRGVRKQRKSEDQRTRGQEDDLNWCKKRRVNEAVAVMTEPQCRGLKARYLTVDEGAKRSKVTR